MTTRLFQQHPVEGSREFELVGDAIVYRIESALGSEELEVVLSVLDPEPIIEGAMLQFVSEVNREPLVALFVDRPDAPTFNAFVSALRERIAEEDFGRLAANNRESPIAVEQITTTIDMLETYLEPEGIAGLLAALRDLRDEPADTGRLSRVVDAFNDLGAQQGPVLTYAPFFNSLLPATDLDDMA